MVMSTASMSAGAQGGGAPAGGNYRVENGRLIECEEGAGNYINWQSSNRTIACIFGVPVAEVAATRPQGRVDGEPDLGAHVRIERPVEKPAKADKPAKPSKADKQKD